MVNEEIQRELQTHVAAIREALHWLVYARGAAEVSDAQSHGKKVLQSFDQYVERAAEGEKFEPARVR
jgi:hypothetical protein